MSNTYRPFWTCKCTFGKTWGLKPRVVSWIYTMMIRTVLTQSSVVWRPRMKYNVSKKGLSKIQKLACLAITGAMKMTPRAEMEFLLGLPALHVMWWLRQRPGQGSTECVPNCGDLNTLTSITPKNLSMWSTKPPYRWSLTGCYKDMYTTSHYQSSSLASMYSKKGSTQTKTGPDLVYRQVQN